MGVAALAQRHPLFERNLRLDYPQHRCAARRRVRSHSSSVHDDAALGAGDKIHHASGSTP
jgi:hypothetical protein